MSGLMCPRCGADLVERQRSEVTIDVCTGCRGVWLDRGELEKITARAAADFEHAQRGSYDRAPDSDRVPSRDRYDRAPDSDRPHYKKKRSSIFDIFD